MELAEREGYLDLLAKQFENVAEGEGHCILITGEAGIGKTALVKAFCKQKKEACEIFLGACDDLFTPRPLAPLYDILSQMNRDMLPKYEAGNDRSGLFSKFFEVFRSREKMSLIIFEDIHWADEATLDFIKFFARRISQLPCLFLLTYRDEEIQLRHSLRNVLGQLPPDTFTKISVNPLSKAAVEEMAIEKGYNGEDVFSISGGNPFYVNEILASYSPGVPDNIKDSILSVYERQKEGTKQAWQLFSVIPEGLELNRFAKIKASWDEAMDHCFAMNVIIVKNDIVLFKHELYRRTIAESLSPFKRIALNKKILDLLLDSFEEKGEIERIVHYAKNANENKLVVKYAPLVASKAECVGSHFEAAKLYLLAIEYSGTDDTNRLLRLFEAYAYECYLTGQVKEAIIYTDKSLALREEKNDPENRGECLCLLSRLWWLDGNRTNAERFANQAVDLLAGEPSSAAKAMAFSNMSQLKMLFDENAGCIEWGEKAIAIARESDAQAALSHAMNNVGSVLMDEPSSLQKGIVLLQESLAIALKNSFHEHAARAYSNLVSNGVKLKQYQFADKILNEGIRYCEERDLESWRQNMLSLKAAVQLETGDWNTAYSIADGLLKNEGYPGSFNVSALLVVAKIHMRTGSGDPLPQLLKAEAKAFETMELQKIIPSLIGMLEFEWLTGKTIIKTESLAQTISRIDPLLYSAENSELTYWLQKARKQPLQLKEIHIGFDLGSPKKAQKAASFWERSGCHYLQALSLADGSEADKKKGLLIFQQLGAKTTTEKLKLGMRASGIKNIPRGIRESTKANPGQLTNRELDIIHLLQKAAQNKEIADTLFISPKTVDNHITSILFKLDVNSRSKAVAEAQRLGILK